MRNKLTHAHTHTHTQREREREKQACMLTYFAFSVVYTNNNNSCNSHNTDRLKVFSYRSVESVLKLETGNTSSEST